MKILHINSYYRNNKFYKNLYDNQIKSGLDIDVFVPVPSTFENNDFDYGEYSKISKNHNKYDRIIFHLKHHKVYKNIRQNYRIKDYSITHAHSLFSNGYIAMKLKKEYGIPYIVAVRSTDLNLFFKKMIHLRNLGVEILKEAKQVIFLSELYKDQVIEKYVPENLRDIIEKKVSIIPNGLEPYFLNNKNSKKILKTKEEIKIITAGYVCKRKNQVTVCEAIELINNLGIKASYTIVGRILDEKLFNRIMKYQFVKYIPFMPQHELIDEYRKADIFVMPSLTETFGLTYLEAMSQGLPVIYSKGQGFDGQFTEGEVGYHVNSIDPNDIKNRILDTIENYDTISNNCLKAVDKYNWIKIAEQYSNLYKKIINSD